MVRLWLRGKERTRWRFGRGCRLGILGIGGRGRLLRFGGDGRGWGFAGALEIILRRWRKGRACLGRRRRVCGVVGNVWCGAGSVCWGGVAGKRVRVRRRRLRDFLLGACWLGVRRRSGRRGLRGGYRWISSGVS